MAWENIVWLQIILFPLAARRVDFLAGGKTTEYNQREGKIPHFSQKKTGFLAKLVKQSSLLVRSERSSIKGVVC